MLMVKGVVKIGGGDGELGEVEKWEKVVDREIVSHKRKQIWQCKHVQRNGGICNLCDKGYS